jgi:SAM-dependent methyltransferase
MLQRFRNWLGGGHYYLKGISPIVRPLRRVLRGLRYRGDAVECPLCQRTFKSWVNGKPHGLCPYCESGSRHRMLWLHLADHLKSVPGKKVRTLHFAPEFCTTRVLRADPRIEYVSADLFEPEAMLRLDITRIDLPDESLDLVLCSHVLEHVVDDARAMRELRRIIRGDGGRVILQIPQRLSMQKTYEDWSITDPDARHQAFGQHDHVRVYGVDFVDRLRDAGFDVEVIHVFQQLPEDLRTRYGLWDDRIYSCARAATPHVTVSIPAVASKTDSHTMPALSAERDD